VFLPYLRATGPDDLPVRFPCEDGPMRAFSKSFAWCAFAALMLHSAEARAGGGPANVIVLYNADDPSATDVAKHYEKARNLPVGHLCGLKGIDPKLREIDATKYKDLVQKPFDACLAAVPQPDDIDYVVLVRGLPYRVTLPSYVASLEAVVQVHHATKVADGTEIAGGGQPNGTQASVLNPMYLGGSESAGDFTIANPYRNWYTAASKIVRAKELPLGYRRAAATTKGGYQFANNLFIVSRLDGFDYKDANDLIDRAVAADGTFPKAEILCMHAEDEARGARDAECEFTIRMLKAASLNGVWLDTFDGKLAGHTVAGYFSGSAATIRDAIAGNTYVPGAITDNLTSVGADPSDFFCTADGKTCPAAEVQTSIARYVRAGATGAHGAVSEPLNNVFPNAGALLLYTFGYSMGESYLGNQRFLYWQNIYLGDPLVTPYAERPKVTVPATVQKGRELTVTATHPNGVAAMNLYIAGKRVAQSAEGRVTFAIDGAVGSKLDVLAVGIATNVPVTRTGWNNPDQHPRPDVQGWTATTVTIADFVPDPDGGPGSDADIDAGGDAGGPAADPGTQDSSGCSCSSPGPSSRGMASALGFSLLALLVVSRRRR